MEEDLKILEDKDLLWNYSEERVLQAINNLIQAYKEQKVELEKKDKIINDAIIAVENLRQYFSEDLQPDFIGILEILKDKKVIDW